MHQDYFYQTMILGGLIALNLIFLLSTFIVVKATKIRVSGASMIASLVFTWPTILMLGLMFPPTKASGWLAALFMLTSLFSYLFWLRVFQPKSLQDMIRSDLKARELESLSFKREYLKKQLTKYRKDKKMIVELGKVKEDLLEIKLMRRSIRINYLESNLLKKLLNKFFKTHFDSNKVN